MFDWQKKTREAMLIMISKNRNYIEATHDILKNIHNDYIYENSQHYSKEELIWINHFFDSVIYKDFLVRIAVEQLQTVRLGKIGESLWPAIENSLDSLDCSQNEQVLSSFALESFLFETSSFLEIYMIFVCLLLKTGFTKEYMSKSVFYNELSKPKELPFSNNAKWIKNYFENQVFGYEDNTEASIFRKDWGRLVRDLRNKIAHRDIILKSFDSEEKFINDIRLNWPTLNKITYHSFSEIIGNGIHALFTKGLCHIYELNWDDYLLSINR